MSEKYINKELILRERLALQRTGLANQTTLLSFIRTSLCFLIAGLSLESLLKMENSFSIEILFFGVAIGLFIAGVYDFLSRKKQLKWVRNMLVLIKMSICTKMKFNFLNNYTIQFL